MPADLDAAGNAHDRDAAVLDAHAVTGPEHCRVISRPGFEPRVSGLFAFPAPLEERGKRLIELAQHLLFRGRRPAAEIRQFLPHFGQTQRLAVIVDAPGLVGRHLGKMLANVLG